MDGMLGGQAFSGSEEILALRDGSWLLLQLGWGGLYLLFIAPLRPRGDSFLRAALACLVCVGLPICLRYGSYLSVSWDILLALTSWTALCLLLKKVHWRTAFYGAVSVVVIRELALILSHDLIVELLLMPLLPQVAQWGWNLIHSLISLLIGLGLTLLFRPWIFRHDKGGFGWGQMALVLLPFLAYAYARNMQFFLRDRGLSGADYQLRMGVLLLLVGFCDLAVAILADNVLSTHIQQEELRRMETILQKQKEEYLAQKAASDAVRQKYHDLKNCLLSLRTAPEEGQKKLAGEIEQIIGPLEGAVDTGNEYLDVVLSEKMALCRTKGISLVPYADGQKLGFVEGLDLCVMVGNALDNAIEAVEVLPPERREIHVKIGTGGGMALLHFQNYCSTPPKKDSRGLYPTGKADAENHGYGLKGILQAVEKYGGTMASQTEGESFTLTLLIPLQPE